MFPHVGRIIEVSYDAGYHFIINYRPDNKMQWTSIVPRTDGGPMTGEETMHAYQQGQEIFTVNWIEQSGTVVSQNLDFAQLKVHSFMSWPDPEGRGGRAFIEMTGKITILSP